MIEVDDGELSSFINTIYREPYSLIHNNCLHKSLRIREKAKERGKQTDLVFCISVVPIKRLHNFPTVNLHMYALIDGEKVDVSLDPGHEARYCRNSEKSLLFPVNISKMGRSIRRITGFKRFQRDLDRNGY